ncbi:MAG: aminotransferase class I/II-fold pyridoxal phosphate-dependent enzyme [Flavobacteriales bacterium]|nr:aminotransferase class I/II-fold pyridoxal phosphate-dependent enzyme [Flavobacteriales bacterium]
MTKHNQIIDTVYDIISAGVDKKVLHLSAQDTVADGRIIKVDNNTLVNFASYSYLGLEVNPTLKNAAIQATRKYGTQFGASRAYVSINLYEELEQLFDRIFNARTLIAPSTTLAHQAAIPVLVRDEDAIIMDQHVHASIQTTVKMVQARNVPVELLRHNRLDQLEDKIKRLRQKHRKIWYMLDGVYSMYGNFAPLKEIYTLLNVYPQLHIYVDDAHGMSWSGKHGSGYALSQIELHPRMILVTSLNKAFAGSGGAMVFPDHEQYRRVRTCGGTLIFSTPIQPPMLGVNIGSAKIHLSEEINVLQRKLEVRIEHCYQLLSQTNLPVVSSSSSPIFYIGLGKPKTAYNMIARMMKEGYYLSIGLFPAVSMKCSGLRGCINIHQSLTDIESMVNAMKHHLPLVLKEENTNLSEITKSFKHYMSEQPPTPAAPPTPITHSNLIVHTYSSISSIDNKLWDSLLGSNGSFNSEGLKFLEATFRDNPEPENNWNFYYFVVVDEKGFPILATFFTVTLCKDDIFSPPAVSQNIESLRAEEPYHMCSTVLMMGSPMTEGQHLYLDRNNINWRDALQLLLNEVSQLQEDCSASIINLRDFSQQDLELRDLFLAEGFVKTDLPHANIINQNTLSWTTIDDYLKLLTSKSRRHFRKDIQAYQEYFDIDFSTSSALPNIDHLYKLYLNVKRRSYELNTFDLPKKVFLNMLDHPNWEVVQLSLKAEHNDKEQPRPIAVIFSFRSPDSYCPMFLGLDYDYLFSHKIYKQILFQVVSRARDLGSSNLYFGFTADLEKHKLGAIQIPKVAYIQTSDTYSIEVLELSKLNTHRRNTINKRYHNSITPPPTSK